MSIAVQIGLHAAASHFSGISNPKAAALQTGVSMIVSPIVTTVTAAAGIVFGAVPAAQALDYATGSGAGPLVFGVLGAGIVGGVAGIVAGAYAGKKVCEYYNLPISYDEIAKLTLLSAVANVVIASTFNQ